MEEASIGNTTCCVNGAVPGFLCVEMREDVGEDTESNWLLWLAITFPMKFLDSTNEVLDEGESVAVKGKPRSVCIDRTWVR